MVLQTLLKAWLKEASFKKLIHNLQAIPQYRSMITGLDGGSRIFCLAGLAYHVGRPVLIITADSGQAERVYSELLAYFPFTELHLLPPRELFISSDILTRSGEQREQRLHFMEWLYRGAGGIYVAPAAAVLSRMVPPAVWRDLTIMLSRGAAVERELLLTKLVELGYERTTVIEAKGQFSARGDILDIFPPGHEMPVRLELFGEELESIRRFDYRTQRSIDSLDRVVIAPALEYVVDPASRLKAESLIRRDLERLVKKLRQKGENETANRLKTGVEQHLIRLARPEGLDLLDVYFAYFYGDGATVLDYLDDRFLAVFVEPADIVDAGETLRRELLEHRRNFFLQGELLPGQCEPIFNTGELLSGGKCPAIFFNLFGKDGGSPPVFDVCQLSAQSIPYYHGQWKMLEDDCRRWLVEGWHLYVLARTPERVAHIESRLRELGLPAVKSEPELQFDRQSGRLQIVNAVLDEGFAIPSLRLALISERNLVPRRPKKKRFRHREGVDLRDYRELNVGDYVVHEQHGIGKYLGLSTLEVNGVQRDYLLVKYSGTDKLYIPVEQINLIQKYIGEEGRTPRLHSLGSGEWNRLKNKVKKSVHDMAQELLQLYAARQLTRGFAFGPDHPWQMEFEDRFPYEETPDQLQAIAEVKADLGKDQPMDRLICGDVGYGKTEVALRAAFKVAMEGKQVALLVPTTILAQQHFRTFLERFQDFPIKVAQLSRFVSLKTIKNTLEELASGRIDIIIGTHRLLSSDVHFKDLGLLIIDEEQRFGVRHKEKLKKMRLNVDVLSMTATPIPRTLHLSLVGSRDLSIIETPPENRYPVQTFVVEYSDLLVKEAVQRELNRKGQVFFVYNRVKGIRAMANHLKKFLHGVRIAVAHGQMPEASLEQVMSDFLEKKYDVLLSTTIIEAGLDIPNVNTLLVYDADNFGLAQLYQLRGRVGRSDRQAYAYLTYRKNKIISETARKRLQAIKEFTEFGSGFKVALRDLEIRGAGNILGAEQHGFMVAVGFDLYCRLLERAINDVKQVKKEELPEPRLELQIDAYLPNSYIPNQEQKIDFYQRIYTAKTLDELSEVEEELRDRYGAPPLPVRQLLAVAGIKVLARALRVEVIRQEKQHVTVKFNPEVKPDSEELWKMIRKQGGKYSIMAGSKGLNIKIKREKGSELVLEDLQNLMYLAKNLVSQSHVAVQA